MADDSQTVYRRLVNDKRVSHGAFRLWHYLRDRANADGKCWPQQRQIAGDIGCKLHSLAGWISELQAAGYLGTERIGQNHFLRYTVLSGDAQSFALPVWATPRAAERGNAKSGVAERGNAKSGVAERGNAKSGVAERGNAACCPKGNVVLPVWATPRVAQKGNVSNTSVVITESKGEAPKSLSKVERIAYERELMRVGKELEKLGNASDYGVEHPNRKRIAELSARQTELRQLLGVKA